MCVSPGEKVDVAISQFTFARGLGNERIELRGGRNDAEFPSALYESMNLHGSV